MMPTRNTEPDQAPQQLPGATDAPQPTPAQRRYLARGLQEPGGKLPLFDESGREVSRKTVEACIGHGWAERWIANPVKPDWVVCKLTAAGYRVLGAEAPQAGPGERRP
jgi:hypothetical protein